MNSVSYSVVISIILGSLLTTRLSPQVRLLEQPSNHNSSHLHVHGYVEEAINVDFTHGHVLNIPKYLVRNLWENYSKDINDTKQFIATDMQRHEAISWAIRNDYRIRWEKPNRYHFIGILDRTDTLSILILNLDGYESLLKIQLLVRAATSRNPRFSMIRTRKDDKVDYERIICNLPPADIVIYGYANTLMSTILQRTPSRELLRYVPRFLVKFLKNSTNWVGRPNHFRPLYVLRTKTDKVIWIISNVYGEEARWLFKSVVARQPRKILITGMAGSIGDKFKVGSFVTPAFWAEESSVSALNWIQPLPNSPVSGIYRRVSTPLVETNKWLREHSFVDLVDVEGGYIMKALQHSRLDTYVSYVISDQIGIKNADLTDWNDEERRANVAKRLSCFLLSLGYNTRSLGLRSLKVYNMHRNGGY